MIQLTPEQIEANRLFCAANAIRSEPEPKPKRRYQLLNIMRVGKPYRPYKFKDLMGIEPPTIAAYLNQLDDEGLVKRELKNGLIWWERAQ